MSYTALTLAQAEKHKAPPSVNPCDDFALGMIALTVVLTGVWLRRRRVARDAVVESG